MGEYGMLDELDALCCLSCSSNCVACSDAHICHSCQPGYLLPQGISGICLDYCATGFLALGTANTCIGNPGRVVDITFA